VIDGCDRWVRPTQDSGQNQNQDSGQNQNQDSGRTSKRFYPVTKNVYRERVDVNMFSALFSRIARRRKRGGPDAAVLAGSIDGKSPVDAFMDQHETPKRVEIFLGHSTMDSPLSPDERPSERQGIDELRCFQEAFVETPISPCESYVSVTDSDGFDGFDPGNIHVRDEEVIDAFIELPLPMSLLSVPGIGVEDREIIRNAGVCNTHQLMGRFLVLRETTTTPLELANRFHDWLRDVGVVHDRSTITASVAGKLGTWFQEYSTLRTRQRRN
jgi:hypothetical protein